MALQIYGPTGRGRSGAQPGALSINAQLTREDAWVALVHSSDERKALTILELAQRTEDLAGFLDIVVGVLHSFPPAPVKAAVCQAARAAGVAAVPYAQEIADLLKDQDPEVRYEACLALGAMGPAAAGAAQAAAALLADASEAVRYGACAALGGTEAAAFSDRVAGLLSDTSLEVQGAACWALGKMGSPGSAHVRTVAKRLSEPRCRLQAIRGLALMGPGAAADFAEDICQCLGDQDIDVRMAAVAAVGQLGTAVSSSPTAFAKVSASLEGEDSRARIAAAVALGNMGHLALGQIGRLKDLLDDEFADRAVDALTVGGCRPRLPPVWRKTRCAAVAALGRIGADSAGSCDVEQLADDIARLLDADDWETQLTTCEALAAMGSRAQDQASKVASLFNDGHYQLRAQAVATCGKLGDPETVAKVVAMMEDKAPTVRAEAVRALPLLGEEGAKYTDKAHIALFDTSPVVRAAAAQALVAFGGRGQFYASAVAQRLVEEDEVPAVRLAAIEALGHMEDRGAVYADLVSTYLEDAQPQLREAAQWSLERLGCGVSGDLAAGAKGLAQLEVGETE